jgi:Mannosyl-glycoprotein endo-beta-N-acetylglucosaminidase
VKINSAIRTSLTLIIFLLASYKVPGGKPVLTEEMKFRTERALFYFQIRDQPFSEDLLKKCIYYERIKYPDIVLLQSHLETGYYTSDIFLNGNNCFGMRFPKCRPTTAIGTYKEHAQYSHWSESVIDYALWQEWYLSRGYRIGGSNDDAFYLVFLNCVHYAQDSHYVSKLVEMSQRDMT